MTVKRATKNLLGFDLGASSGRALVGCFDGNKLALKEIHRFPNGQVNILGSLRWKIPYLFSEIKTGLAKAVNQTGRLASLGVDTWAVDFGLLDRAGQLIEIPYCYRDSRTEGMVEIVCSRVSREEVFEQTGIQFMPFNSLLQLMAMVTNGSPTLEIAHTFLTVPDLFNYWLTGQKVCEFTNATTTQCYNSRAGDWAKSMLAKLGIPTHIFPQVVAPGTQVGALLPAVSKEVGVSGGLPVIAPASHDTGSAVVAVPATGGDFVWMSSGTWSIMGVEVPQPIINEQVLAATFTNEGGAANTIRLCRNVMGLWLVQECRRIWAAEGKDYSYGDLMTLAEQSAPLQAIVEPDDDDFYKPGDMPQRIRTFCQRTGQSVSDSDGAIIRCVLDSLALKYRWVLERLDDLLGRRLEPIHIVGGGSQNRLLNQLTADATGRPVIAGPVEATAIGNLLMQAISLGEIESLTQAREVVKRSFEVTVYEPSTGLQWDEAYARLLGFIE